ncbi:MAG: (Fe-S)-binding protein [Methanobacterium sp.]|nr:(Fe-S)-binding protein [Methanobacterium sp.]
MLYFRGCVVRDKLPHIGEATGKILDKAHLDYHILENEGCCGSFLLRTGFTDEALEIMKRNLEDFKNEKIVVSCAGCFNTLKNDYKELLGEELDVVHTSQLFRDLINKGTLKPKKIPLTICYHDPCHLGRHCGEYQAPRDVLDSITVLVEMEKIKENSRCCGAGGGVKSAYPPIAEKLASNRLKDFQDTDADFMITSCSFCLLNLKDACEKLNNEQCKASKVKDLSEILLEALKD